MPGPLIVSLVAAAILIQVAVLSTTIFLHRTATHRALVLHPGVAWMFGLLYLVLIVAAALTMVVAGGADNISSIFRNTMVQSAVPDAIRGRLQGVFIVVVAGGPRLQGRWLIATTPTAAWRCPAAPDRHHAAMRAAESTI